MEDSPHTQRLSPAGRIVTHHVAIQAQGNLAVGSLGIRQQVRSAPREPTDGHLPQGTDSVTAVTFPD